MNGVRGELNCQAKLQFFGDINPFKDSSAGVQFYSISTIPANYRISSVYGFVSALETMDDPEYHWSDNFRSPRKSNESRTLAMFRLAGNCRRELGKKALDLGGNAVIGCKQYFDLEASQRIITVRSIGTAVKIVHLEQPRRLSVEPTMNQNANGLQPGWPVSTSPLISPNMPLSAPTLGSVGSPQKSGTITVSGDIENHEFPSLPPPLILQQSNWKTVDVILLTLDQFPKFSISCMGGFVCATSIKILESDEGEIRESWWNELREEIRSHGRRLNCNTVLGYTETISIHEEVAVLFCSGTAAQLDMASGTLRQYADEPGEPSVTTPIQPSPPANKFNSINMEFQRKMSTREVLLEETPKLKRAPKCISANEHAYLVIFHTADAMRRFK